MPSKLDYVLTALTMFLATILCGYIWELRLEQTEKLLQEEYYESPSERP